jgi:hypothetical protein
MASLAGMLAYAVVLAYDLSRVFSIVDVGGGNGRFLETILAIYPEIQGTVFDCAPTIERTRGSAVPRSRRCLYVGWRSLRIRPAGWGFVFPL